MYLTIDVEGKSKGIRTFLDQIISEYKIQHCHERKCQSNVWIVVVVIWSVCGIKISKFSKNRIKSEFETRNFGLFLAGWKHICPK